MTFAEGMGETLATKAGLGKTEGTLQGQMRELEQSMATRPGVMMVGAAALVVALNKLP